MDYFEGKRSNRSRYMFDAS